MVTPPFGVPFGTPPDEIRAALRADLERRLMNVCSEWSPEDFERLVEDVTSTGLKYLTPPREDALLSAVIHER